MVINLLLRTMKLAHCDADHFEEVRMSRKFLIDAVTHSSKPKQRDAQPLGLTTAGKERRTTSPDGRCLLCSKGCNFEALIVVAREAQRFRLNDAPAERQRIVPRERGIASC